MSEVPEGNEGPNPFSFKNFVKRTSTTEQAQTSSIASKGQRSARSGSRRRGEDKKDPANIKKKKKKPGGGGGESEELPFPDLGATADAGKRSSEDDNPFSFTKFVKKKESKQAVPTVIREATLESSDTNTSSDNDSGDNTNDVIVRPPKVPSGKSSPSQAKRTTKPSKSSSASVLTNVSLKSAPLVSSSNSSTVPPASKTAKRINIEKKEPSKLFPDSDSSSSDEDLHVLSGGIPKPVAMDTRTYHAHVGGGSLEDLFDEPTAGGDSGGLLLGNNKKRDSSSSDESIGSPEVTLPSGISLNINEDMISGTALEQLSKLKAENARLKEEVQQSREEARHHKEKNVSLKQKVKALKKKEAEETKALEEMVLKVESNLVATTKRALSAEATIVKLKQEISTLQTRLAQSTPESVHQYYEEMLMGVREKANYSSQQLVLAAQMADQSIRELAGGVDTLKNIAEILQFIDNICEIKDKTS